MFSKCYSMLDTEIPKREHKVEKKNSFVENETAFFSSYFCCSHFAPNSQTNQYYTLFFYNHVLCNAIPEKETLLLFAQSVKKLQNMSTENHQSFTTQLSIFFSGLTITFSLLSGASFFFPMATCQRFFPKFKITTSVYFISRMQRERKNSLQTGVKM